MREQHDIRLLCRPYPLGEFRRHPDKDFVGEWKARSRRHALASVDDHRPHAELARVNHQRHRDLARPIDDHGFRWRESLASRLWAQLLFASIEVRRDPEGYLRALAASDAFDGRSRRVLWSVRLGVQLDERSRRDVGLVTAWTFDEKVLNSVPRRAVNRRSAACRPAGRRARRAHKDRPRHNPN